ncbi:DUF1177 family protein [Providencia rustigianii]|uniref:Protein of uncharacterized function (DUF1177) n=1 Tax=Providencia rustigianii TaxID=158850 RepID=A0A379G238_9GAMM|nr:DUF1177 domain-containing protein [Providencia rustigianii]MTC61681.1 DUF1177 family protein [Providencia rustigianii]SUC34971.1 Protein of uncharacterised function (DUF1177) [Providencia rustigianii]VEH54767.1 Protein of uncharacterised function (DUF1177) [Providencia rustigianii]
MTLKQTLCVYELLDCANVSGNDVVKLFQDFPAVQVTSTTVTDSKGQSDFIRITIPGTQGKSKGYQAPTLGIIGRLGGIGARPSRVGVVSDADGAIAAITAGLKLAQMQQRGDKLLGDVIITTHICPNAPTRPHTPVDFMDSPLEDQTMNQYEGIPEADAILSVDTTKGNRLLNHKGYALSPTVKAGYILPVSEDLLRLMEWSSGQNAVTFPLSIQDITPYGNGLHHINSIMQPAVSTLAPVVGVAICTETVVPGCSTGSSHEVDIAASVKFIIEVAKEFGEGKCSFYDLEQYQLLTQLYGDMKHLQDADQ